MAQNREPRLYEDLAYRLRSARLGARLSLERVAMLADVGDRVTVFNIERKPGGVPLVDTVEKIARALRRSPAWLAYGIDCPYFPPIEPLRSTMVGLRLELWFSYSGASASALAKDAGISCPTVNHVAVGKTMPNVATVEAIAGAMKESPAWLAFGQKQPRWYRRRIEYLTNCDQRPDTEAAALAALQTYQKWHLYRGRRRLDYEWKGAYEEQ